MSDRVHHLYVHLPFCAHRCGYCDFVTVVGRRGNRALAVGNATTPQVVRAQLNLHAVAEGHTDVELAHLARGVGENFLAGVQAHPELAIPR